MVINWRPLSNFLGCLMFQTTYDMGKGFQVGSTMIRMVNLIAKSEVQRRKKNYLELKTGAFPASSKDGKIELFDPEKLHSFLSIQENQTKKGQEQHLSTQITNFMSFFSRFRETKSIFSCSLSKIVPKTFSHAVQEPIKLKVKVTFNYQSSYTYI